MVEHLGRQQDLRHVNVEFAKRAAILLHQQRLADGGTGLAHLHIRHGAFEFQQAGPHADGAAGDDDDLPPVTDKYRKLAGHVADVIDIDAAILAQGRRADLDHDSFG